MKYKQVKIQFSIPHFKFIDDAIYNTKQSIAYLKWKLIAPKCVVTGKKLFTTNYDLRGNRIGFSKTCIHDGEIAPLSAEGFLIQLSKYLDVCDYRVKTCSCCGLKKPTISIIWKQEAEKLGVKYLESRFCMNWWNGHDLCRDCLLENAKNAVPSINYICYRNGKQIVRNKQGLKIEVEKLIASKLW